MKRVVHIVPTVPPEFNGLGDYAYQLWKHWPEPKPEWHILATRIPQGAKDHWPEVKLHAFEMYGGSLVDELLVTQARTVVLHYVPHAYQPKGVPVWLPKALAKWKGQANGRLVIVFHELFATAPLWRLTGWLAPLAKMILRDLVTISDGWTTSCNPYYDQLTKIGKANPENGRLLPIGPNISPFKRLPGHRAGRRKNVVVFGFGGSRLLALKAHVGLLKRFVKQDEIDKLLLVGKSPSWQVLAETNKVTKALGLADCVEYAFDLSPEAVSDLLSRQDIALIATEAAFRGKSSVYASCKAHGLRCVFPGELDLSGTLIADSDSVPTWAEISGQIAVLTEH